MKAEAQPSSKPESRRPLYRLGFVRIFCLCGFLVAVASAGAAPKLSADNALGFFTNAASAMFKQQNLRDNQGNLITVTNIPVWPLTNNNFYTPAVHRLLQVAANIFECTTTNLYPCIYRPRFISDGTNISICDYELVNGPDNDPTSVSFLTLPLDLNDSAARATIGTNATSANFYGIPWVIGARKGFPNLNQIAMQSVSQMTRRLMVYRPLFRSGWLDYHGKQMFVIGVSNSVAVEVWNSYNATYPRPLFIQADCKMTVQLANDVGFAPAPFTFNLGGGFGGWTNLPAGALTNTGLQPPTTPPSRQPNVQSFVVPLQTNLIVFPDSVQIGNTMIAANDSTALWNAIPWDNLIDPHWVLNITNNLRCIVMDGGLGGRVVDYVQLSRMDSQRNLTQETLQTDRLDVWNENTNASSYWSTSANPMSQGVLKQILISVGSMATSSSDWADNGLPSGTKAVSIAAFYNFMYSSTVASNTMLAPFTPTSKIYQLTKWQANDPLVHYLSDDLTYLDGITNVLVPLSSLSTMATVVSSMYRLNERFSPWGGFGPKTLWDKNNLYDPHLFDTTIKDPLVMVSDNWNFPSNQPLSFSWLGHVHRGTPWQTLYLKSRNILDTDLSAWKSWTGTVNPFIATNLAPINDWRLLSCLNSLISTNDLRQLLSVNNPDTNAWLGIMDGFTVLTNDASLAQLYPVILASNSPQAGFIVSQITQKRAMEPAGYYQNVGDILAVPELTDASPWLETNSWFQVNAGGVSDEDLEKIPSQLLPLLRADSIGSVAFGNGQLLVQFTGDDNYSYVLEMSSNLVDWIDLSTNIPVNGAFDLSVGTATGAGQRYYRSILWP